MTHPTTTKGNTMTATDNRGWTVVYEDENGSERRATYPNWFRADAHARELRDAGYRVTIEDEAR